MAFNFKDLSITLTTGLSDDDPREPHAVLAVVGCGTQSLMIHFRTCEVRTQGPCPTNPEELKPVEIFTGLENPDDIRALRQALKDLLAEADTSLSEWERLRSQRDLRDEEKTPDMSDSSEP